MVVYLITKVKIWIENTLFGKAHAARLILRHDMLVQVLAICLRSHFRCTQAAFVRLSQRIPTDLSTDFVDKSVNQK